MGRIVNPREVLKVERRVNLRRGYARMAEQFLYGAQIAARLQHVRGHRVTQHVGMNVLVEAELAGTQGDALLHAAQRLEAARGSALP